MRGVIGIDGRGGPPCCNFYPLGALETPKETLLHGGYPEALALPASARLWFASYFAVTYLERDVRAVTAVKDLATFRTLLSLLASRHGQLPEQDRSGRAARVSACPTIAQWLGVLETTAQILIVPPFYENPRQTPGSSRRRCYIADFRAGVSFVGNRVGGRAGQVAIRRQPVRGLDRLPEIIKAQVNAGQRRGALSLPRRTGS
jgi:hypothetical protein